MNVGSYTIVVVEVLEPVILIFEMAIFRKIMIWSTSGSNEQRVLNNMSQANRENHVDKYDHTRKVNRIM
jgi:hypothetical protein